MKRARGISDNGAKESLFNGQEKSSNKCIDKFNQLAGEVTADLCRIPIFWSQTEPEGIKSGAQVSILIPL